MQLLCKVAIFIFILQKGKIRLTKDIYYPNIPELVIISNSKVYTFIFDALHMITLTLFSKVGALKPSGPTVFFILLRDTDLSVDSVENAHAILFGNPVQ